MEELRRSERKYTKSLVASAVLFETETRKKAYRQQMESLVNGEIIDNGVVDAWCEFLNSLEILRGENSMSRFFLPTFVVDKNLFGSEAKANESVTRFMMDVEKVNERAEKDSIRAQLDDIEVANVPVKNMKLPSVGK
ncbi:hypothetical protein Tco_0792396 [Tanacetum coccineum]